MREKEWARTSHDKKSWFALVTHRLGLPFHGSPLCVFLPLGVFLHRMRRRWAHIPKKWGGSLGELQLRGWERAGAVT